MSIVSDLISPVNHNDQLQIQQSRVMLSNCLFPPHTDIIWLRGSRVLDTGPGEEQGLVARQILLGSLVICENQHLISGGTLILIILWSPAVLLLCTRQTQLSNNKARSEHRRVNGCFIGPPFSVRLLFLCYFYYPQ